MQLEYVYIFVFIVVLIITGIVISHETLENRESVDDYNPRGEGYGENRTYKQMQKIVNYT